MNRDKEEFKRLIKSNIEEYGHHVSIVAGGPDPRYAYTIGLYEKVGFELIIAGAVLFLKEDILKILNDIASATVNENKNTLDNQEYLVGEWGDFKIRETHNSWNELMLLGVFDYYDIKKVKAYQILPGSHFFTADIPNMSTPFIEKSDPIWKWLKSDWELDLPKDVSVVTNIDALQGEPITEVMRWEELEWEMFAGPGPDVEKEDIRVVPIAVMLGIDNTLNKVLTLEVGKGIWRKNHTDEWKSWG